MCLPVRMSVVSARYVCLMPCLGDYAALPAFPFALVRVSVLGAFAG